MKDWDLKTEMKKLQEKHALEFVRDDSEDIYAGTNIVPRHKLQQSNDTDEVVQETGCKLSILFDAKE